MRKIFKKSILCSLCIVWTAGAIAPIVFSQEEKMPLVKEVTGKITSIDAEKSTLVVNYVVDEKSGSRSDVAIKVNDLTFIEKDYEMVKLPALKLGDEVSLEYSTGQNGENVATYILVKTKEE